MIHDIDIPGHRVKDVIGTGGMAIVYRAEQESLGRDVALKILNPLFASTPEFSQRFLNEGRLLASLAHTNIVTIHELGIHDGNHFIAMEYLAGGDLRARMNGPQEPSAAFGYVRTILSALGAAHAKGIVHRDLKPANILFRDDGTLVLTDFGIAKRLGGDSDLTMTGATLGSPHYISPEQARTRDVDGRSDIYSLGVLLYEMLVGHRPIDAPSEIDIIIRHVNGEFPPLPDEWAQYQPLLDSMTATSPDDRCPDVETLAGKLDEAAALPPPVIALSRSETPSLEASLASAPTRVNPAIPRGSTVDSESSEGADASEGVGRPAAPTNAAPSASRVESGSAHRAGASSQDEPGVSSAGPVKPRSVPRRRFFPLAGAGTLSALVLIGALYFFASRDGGPGGVAMLAPGTSTYDAEVSQTVVPLEQLVKEANALLASKKLTTPKGDNAHELYKEILGRDPGNAAARRGIAEIADEYVLLANNAVSQQDLELAERYVARGLGVVPGHAALVGLQAQIDQIRGN